MEEIVLIVTAIDYAYEKPLSKIIYAGTNLNKAYSIFNSTIDDEKVQINLDLAQGETIKRIETKHLF